MVYWKKAQLDASNLVKILLFLTVAIVIMMFFTGFIDISKKSADDGTCRITAVMNNNLKTLGKDPISLKCPRKTILIDEDKVQYKQADNKWKDVKRFTTKLSSDKNQFYKVAADEMGDCWYKMGEGKLNIFNKDFITGYYRKTCLICGEIKFNENPGLNLGTSEDFIKYLKTYNYTRNGINKVYYDYMLMQYPPQWSPRLLDLYFNASGSLFIYGFDKKPQFTTSETYVVYFKAMKYTWVADKLFGGTVKIITNGAEWSAPIQYNDLYYIYFSRLEDVSQECQILVN